MALRKSHLGIDYEPFRGFISDDQRDTRLPVDLDGIMERRNKFLVLESKQIGESISMGQRIMLEALARSPHFTVLVLVLSGVKASTGAYLSHVVSYMKIGRDKELVPTTTDEIKSILRDWWNKASENKQL